jgi:hypothetical protein
MKNFIKNIKAGLADAKNMLLEKQYKPFLLPLIILVAVFFSCRYINESVLKQVSVIKGKIEAQNAEIKNEKEYKTSKELYEKFIQNLPPDSKKNEWLLGEMHSLLAKNNIVPSKIGKQVFEESDDVFTLASVSFEMDTDYVSLGKLIASIESFDNFMRVSELTASRASGNLGKLKVSLRVNTIFVKEE